MKVLSLTGEQILSLHDMSECIEEIRKGFALYGQKKVESPLRSRIGVTDVRNILFMPSFVRDETYGISLKVVSIYPDIAGKSTLSALVLLVDGKDGATKAIMDGSALTSIRTGAVSGLSCRYLARRNSKEMAIIGAGGQAFHQISAVAAELRIEGVRIFSRHTERSKELAKRCESQLGVRASACVEILDCLRGADVLVTATTSRTPLFDGNIVEEGTHVIAIGAYTPDSREVDSRLVARSSVYVDSMDAAMEEAGDILIPISESAVTRAELKGELSDLVLGRVEGRRKDSEITLFKSVGLAFEDNLVGWLLYRKAIESGVGTWVEV